MTATSLQPGDLDGLSHLTRLEKLKLIGNRIVDQDLAFVESMPHLEELNLLSTDLTEVSIRMLLKHKSLLDLQSSAVIEDSSAPEVLATQLENLTLTGPGLGDEWARELSKLSRLTFLQLLNTSLTDAGMQEFENLKKLQSLSIASEHLGDAALKSLSGLHKLESLLLDCPSLTDDALKNLSTLPSLKSLHLVTAELTDEGLAELTNFPELVQLQIRNSLITPDSIEHLASMKKLKMLSLQNCRLPEVERKGFVSELQEKLPEVRIMIH